MSAAGGQPNGEPDGEDGHQRPAGLRLRVGVCRGGGPQAPRRQVPTDPAPGQRWNGRSVSRPRPPARAGCRSQDADGSFAILSRMMDARRRELLVEDRRRKGEEPEMSESPAEVAHADHRSGTAIRARSHCGFHARRHPRLDTLSDTLRSGRGCDIWTWLDPEFENSLGKTPIWTPPDVVGQATSGFVIIFLDSSPYAIVISASSRFHRANP